MVVVGSPVWLRAVDAHVRHHVVTGGHHHLRLSRHRVTCGSSDPAEDIPDGLDPVVRASERAVPADEVREVVVDQAQAVQVVVVECRDDRHQRLDVAHQATIHLRVFVISSLHFS
jgi:hypothetical protein